MKLRQRALQWNITLGLVLMVSRVAGASAAAEPLLTPEQLTIERIECSGNAHTSCDLIRHELPLLAGSTVDEEQVREAKTRLILLGLFRDVQISLKRGSERGRAILDINVVELSPYYTELTTGSRFTGSLINQNFAVILGTRNLFGTGKILQADASLDQSFKGDKHNVFHGQLEYIDPSLFGSKRLFATAGINYSAIRDRTPNYLVNEDYLSPYVSVGTRIGTFSYASLRYDQDANAHFHSQEGINSGGYYGYDINRPRTKSLQLLAGWNNLDDLFFPTSGYLINLAGTVRDESFDDGYVFRSLLATGEIQGHWSLTDQWALHLNFGRGQGLGNSPVPTGGAIGYDTSGLATAGISFDLKKSYADEGIRNARVYLNAGYYNPTRKFTPDFYLSTSTPGAELGLRLDIPKVGILNLFFMYLNEYPVR